MADPVAIPAPLNQQALNDHLDARFANRDIERALGGFALMLIGFDARDQAEQSRNNRLSEDLLAAISARVKATLRDSDFLAQFDDRTFAVVIPQISDRDTLKRIAQKLRAALSRPLGNPNAGGADGAQGADGASIRSLTIRSSLFPDDGATRALLVARALEAPPLPE